MIDLDWFLSLLDKEDMVNIVKKMKIQIKSFRNPERAFSSILKKELRDYFLIPQGKKKKVKKISFSEFIENTSRELLNQYSYIEKEDINFFYTQMDTNEELKVYEKVLLFYDLFPDEYNTFQKQIADNISESTSLFNGLAKDIDDVEKIEMLLDVFNYKKRFLTYKDEMRNWLNNVFHDKEIERISSQLQNINEHDFFHQLRQMNENERLLAVFFFLDQQNRYENEKYTNMINYLLLGIQIENKEQYKTKVKESEELYEDKCEQYTQLQQQQSRTQRENERLEQQNKEYVQNIETLQSHVNEIGEEKLQIEERNESLTSENMNLTNTLHAAEQREANLLGIKEHFEMLLNKKEWVIVTDRLHDFKLFYPMVESKIISNDTLQRMIERHTFHNLKNSIIFLSRFDYFSSQQFVKTLRFLRSEGLVVEELNGLSEIENIEMILLKLLRKEEFLYDY